MMSLNYLTVLIQCQIFSNILESIQKHKTLTTNPPIHIYISMVNNSLVFKTKDGYKLELHSPETIKLFGVTQKI